MDPLALTISTLESIEPTEIQPKRNAILLRLRTEIEVQTGPIRFHPVYFALLDEGANLWGGVSAHCVWNRCHIDALWVHRDVRCVGWGGRLLDATEKRAIQNQCEYVTLETFSAEAVEFYSKRAYHVYGVLQGFPRGDLMQHCMFKRLSW